MEKIEKGVDGGVEHVQKAKKVGFEMFNKFIKDKFALFFLWFVIL